MVPPRSRVALHQLCYCFSRLGSLRYLVKTEELPSRLAVGWECSNLLDGVVATCPSSNRCFKNVIQFRKYLLETDTNVLSISSPAHLPISNNFDVLALWRSQLSSQQPWFQARDTGMLHPQSPKAIMCTTTCHSKPCHAKSSEANRDTRKFSHPSIPSSKFGNGGVCCDCP